MQTSQPSQEPGKIVKTLSALFLFIVGVGIVLPFLLWIIIGAWNLILDGQ